jgi:hypothetical protein
MLINRIAAAQPVRISRAISTLYFCVNKVFPEFGTQERLSSIYTDSLLLNFTALTKDQIKPSILFWQQHDVTHFRRSETESGTIGFVCLLLSRA